MTKKKLFNLGWTYSFESSWSNDKIFFFNNKINIQVGIKYTLLLIYNFIGGYSKWSCCYQEQNIELFLNWVQ